MIFASLIGTLLSAFFYLNVSWHITEWRWPSMPPLIHWHQSYTNHLVRLASNRLFSGEPLCLVGQPIKYQSGAALPTAMPRLPVFKNATTTPLVIQVKSAYLLDRDTETELYAQAATEPRPIASITKLMTALVFLENNPGWNQVYEIIPADRRDGGKIYFYSGDKVTIKDLFNVSLVASGNSETVALAHSTGLSTIDFLEKMNRKAKDLGLEKTEFFDVVGLDVKNQSTARELAILVKTAMAHPEILKATSQDAYVLSTKQGKRVSAVSTNQLLDGEKQTFTVLGGKTGHLEAAGYCFVGLFADKDGNQVISVILGAGSEDARFTETKKLVNWGYENYQWP
ncbi:MAG: serine hydrolase [Candidatus Falkowbacteria bacterium]